MKLFANFERQMKIKKLKRVAIIAATIISLLSPLGTRAEKSIYIPTFYGTLRARYEYLTQQNLSAFKVRTLRLGLDGYVAPVLGYNVEVDFHDWGHITLINAFIRLSPVKGLTLNMGQLRVPFTIAAHRQPHEQYFADRTFLAKHAGLRDVGLTGSYAIPKVPLTVQGAFFNCSGVGIDRDFFTRTFGFSTKLISQPLPNWYFSASTARLKRGIARTQNWDIGMYFDNGLWHIEGEYLRREYVHGVFTPVNAYDFFVFRKFPIEKKMISNIAGAIRYDYMGNNSSGLPGEDGKLFADNPEAHRITLGATLSFMSMFQADIRLNYEKYFFKKGVTPTADNDDKIVLEITAHF